jgi:hypothetical protein
MMGSQLANNVFNILQKFTVLALSSEDLLKKEPISRD